MENFDESFGGKPLVIPKLTHATSIVLSIAIIILIILIILVLTKVVLMEVVKIGIIIASVIAVVAGLLRLYEWKMRHHGMQ